MFTIIDPYINLTSSRICEYCRILMPSKFPEHMHTYVWATNWEKVLGMWSLSVSHIIILWKLFIICVTYYYIIYDNMCIIVYMYTNTLWPLKMLPPFTPHSWVVCEWFRLTHWGRVTYICVSKLTSIGSNNGLLPGRRRAILWTNAGILLIGPSGTNFSEILIAICTFSFKKMHLKNGGHFVSASVY